MSTQLCGAEAPWGCFGICTNNSRFRFTLAFALKCTPERGAEQADLPGGLVAHIEQVLTY